MAGLSGTFSQEHITVVAMAGLGATGAAFVQASGIGATLGGNARDAILAVGAMFLLGMGGNSMRAFALGVGAVAVGSLIRNNILVAAGA